MKPIQSEDNIHKIIQLSKEHGHFSGNVVETLASDLLKVRRACTKLLEAKLNHDAELEEDITQRLQLMLLSAEQ